MTWDYEPDPEEVEAWQIKDEPSALKIMREINGYMSGKPEEHLPGFAALKDDGSTTCASWIYSGIYPEAGAGEPQGGLPRAGCRRPRCCQPGLGRWPANRRIIYNRASARPDGTPWSEEKAWVFWDPEKVNPATDEPGMWTGADVPDFVAKAPDAEPDPDGIGLDALSGTDPFIMKADGKGWLYTPTGLVDGPFPTHYEPIESPRPTPSTHRSRTRRCSRPGTSMAIPGPSRKIRPSPTCLTTYRLTEHHLSGVMSRWLPWLAELQPELFVEISPELAGEGIANTEVVRVITPRAEITAKALVTRRMRPMTVAGKTIHHVGLPWHWGYQGSSPDPSRTTSRSWSVTPTSPSTRARRSSATWRRRDGSPSPGDPGRRASRNPHRARRFMTPAGAPRGPDGVLHRHPSASAARPASCLQELERSSSDVFTLSGDSYDNTRELNGENWRHVQFIEQFPEDRVGGRWLLMSDVCKHCVHAGCLEVCPTGAIIRTEYDTVVIQADVCNGCRDCIAACPFGVIEINPVSRTAMKCTPAATACRAGWSPPAPSLSDRLDQVRPSRSCTDRERARAAAQRAGARRGTAGECLPLRRGRFHRRRVERVLSPGRQAGGLPPAGTGQAPLQRDPRGLGARHRRHPRHGRPRRGRLPQAPHGRLRRSRADERSGDDR